MNDRPPFLDRLGDELEEGSTVWRGRRRKRRRIFGGAMAVLLVAGGAVWFASAEKESAQRPVVADSPDSTVAGPGPTSSVPGVDATIVTDADPSALDSNQRELLDDAVAATEDGVFLRRADRPNILVQVSERPAYRAFLLGDTVVYQDAEPGDALRRTPVGPIVVVEAGDVRRFEPVDGSELHLHDVAVFTNRPRILASSVSRSGPEDSDHRLLLINLETGERTDLESLDGRESRVEQARLAGDSLIAAHSTDAGRALVAAINVRSNQQFEIERGGGIAVVGDELWLVDATGVTADDGRVVSVGRHDPNSGADLGEILLFPQFDGVEVPATFCLNASAHAGHLICDQTDGPPLAIDLADGSRTTAVPGFSEGTVSFAPAVPAPRPECDAAAPPLRSSVLRSSPPRDLGEVDLDGDGVAELRLAAVRDLESMTVTSIEGTIDGFVHLPPIAVGAEPSVIPRVSVADLDADGVAEVVLQGFGNTAERAIILHYDGCELQEVVDEAGEGVRLLVDVDVDVGGGGCDGSGCAVRSRCLDGPSGVELEHQTYGPAIPPDGGIVLTTTRYRLEGSTLVELDSGEERFTGVDALPADAPTPEESGSIDC